MPKLFWMLLAAGRGGCRYIRAVLKSAAGLFSRLTQAPGSDTGARMEQDTALDAGMVNRAVSDGRLEVRAGGSLAGHMVAWLVSVAYPAFHAGLAWLNTVLGTAPGAGMGKDARTEITLVDAMDPSPGSPGGIRATREDGVQAGAETAPPVPTRAVTVVARLDLTAGSCATDPAEIKGVWLEVRDSIFAGIGPGQPVMGGGVCRKETALAACMMTWSAPEWVDDKTLYIRQVYEIEQDGTTLILH